MRSLSLLSTSELRSLYEDHELIDLDLAVVVAHEAIAAEIRSRHASTHPHPILDSKYYGPIFSTRVQTNGEFAVVQTMAIAAAATTR